MVLLNGKLYQLVVVPVLAPTAIAWVGVGFISMIARRTIFEAPDRAGGLVSQPQPRNGGWQLHARRRCRAVRGLPAVMPAPGQPGEVSEHGSATEIGALPALHIKRVGWH